MDNDDTGFSIKDANRTWLQKWFEKPLEPRSIGERFRLAGRLPWICIIMEIPCVVVIFKGFGKGITRNMANQLGGQGKVSDIGKSIKTKY